MAGAASLRILGETAYPLTAPTGRIRVANFAPFLRSHGVDLRFHATLTDSEYAVLSSKASAARKVLALGASVYRAQHPRGGHDLYLVHRLRLLSAVPGLEPPRRVDAYDLDDALFLGSPSEANSRFQWAKQEARRCIGYLRRARLVLAGNAFLAQHAREHAARVEVVPTCVDPDTQALRRHAESEVVTVGWIGSSTTSEYLNPVLPVFAKLNEAERRVKLLVVGADTGIREPWIEHRPWSLAEEPSVLASFDVGIMPMPDTDWARGKCGYKILQYFSAGVPAIASPVGVAPELVGQDRGLLARTSEDWANALRTLLEDTEVRRQRGALARAFVEEHYSYRRWAPELATLLRSLANGA